MIPLVSGHNLSICLDISPTQPLRVPDCTFLGPDNGGFFQEYLQYLSLAISVIADIVPLKQKLNSIATSKQWLVALFVVPLCCGVSSVQEPSTLTP